MKHRLVDDRRRPGATGDHHLLGVRGIAQVRVGIAVQRQVRARDHLQRRALRRQVIEVVQHPHQAWRAGLHAEDRRSVWLRVGVDRDPRMPRPRQRIDARRADQPVAEQPLEERDQRRMGDQRDTVRRIRPVHVLARPLVLAVIHADGGQPGKLRLDRRDLRRVEQVGHDDIAFDLEMADVLREAHRRPVGVVDDRAVRCGHRRFSSVCCRHRRCQGRPLVRPA